MKAVRYIYKLRVDEKREGIAVAQFKAKNVCLGLY